MQTEEAGAGDANLADRLRKRPRLLKAICVLKRMRTKAAILVAVWCVAEGLYFHERPLSLAHPGAWAGLGFALIAMGVGFRLAALGCLHKKEKLTTDGVYSLCRHPLYLGSILVAYGFCILLDDGMNYVWVTLYFALFYPVTILWEETRLDETYGDAHRRFRAQTPTLLPLGKRRRGSFSWASALSKGGATLLTVVVLLLVGVEAMAKVL